MAGDCFSAALQVFSKEAFPREFAECNSGPFLQFSPYIYICMSPTLRWAERLEYCALTSVKLQA